VDVNVDADVEVDVEADVEADVDADVVEDDTTLTNSFCTPTPLSIGDDGLPRYIEDKVLVVVVESSETSVVDRIALGETLGTAYTSAVDCSYSLGSIRELKDCEVIPESISSPDAQVFLVRCMEYYSNSMDNGIFMSEEDLYGFGTCECSCTADGADPFPQLVSKSGECDCPCGDSPDCVCYPPFVNTLLENWNSLYQNVTDDVLSIDVTIVDLIEVTVLDPADCDAGEETFINGTIICPGNRTTVFDGKVSINPVSLCGDCTIVLGF
jgi:hypothetical protein